MKIQFNTDNNIEGNDEFTAPMLQQISQKLRHFKVYITRIEVHLSDQDGPRDGPRSRKCVLEARIRKGDPITVTDFSENDLKALSGAIDKLKSALDTYFGKMGYR